MSSYSRRDFLKGAGALGISLALSSELSTRLLAGPTENRMNFVFILVDDLGWVDTACSGSSFYETPNIDRLARHGMRFTDAYSASPVCAPTRAAVMTGLNPARIHLTNHNPKSNPVKNSKLTTPLFPKQLPPDKPTIAEALKKLGYVTACIGKWDLGEKPSYPEFRGFDVSFGGNARGMAKSHFYPKWKGNPDIEGEEGEYLADRLTREAEGFIEANRDKSFFLYLAHYGVHIPHEAKAEDIKHFEGSAQGKKTQGTPVYAAMIKSVDDSVGRIVRKLESLGIADRTVIIFTSDNGGMHCVDLLGYKPATSNLPLREGKGYIYEGGIRVPLVIRWPGVTRSGSVCSEPVVAMDFFPTILDMCGQRGSNVPETDGESLVPLLRQFGTLERDTIYWHYPHYSNQGGLPASAVRQGNYKMIRFYDDDRLELYDLKNDISESNDLSKKMPEKVHELDRILRTRLRDVKAQMPAPNPNYKQP